MTEISDNDLISCFLQNAPQFMWFLGAGTSRTAGMPTATDITWDLKRKYYCLQENQDIQNHDINNDAIKRKIQAYMESKGFPVLWSPEEYSFYFKQTFGDDYSAQQAYLNEQLDPEKISLNIGHRALAALLELQKARIIFTTNFDDVIERSFSEVSGKNLSAFHLEGSYAALEALNAERFPIYAKIHGDFRYQSIKNLSEDLIKNDEEIQKCFLAASNRYGVIVCGYSGRDDNVMAMFREALNQNNAFPHGLFWAVLDKSNILDSVTALIKEAKEKGIKSHIVETGTFDILLSKIWRQLTDKSEALDKKVRTAISKSVSIPFPSQGKMYPILRTNALPIIECSNKCAVIDLAETPSYGELKQAWAESKSQTVVTKIDKILAWGDQTEIAKIFDNRSVKSIESYDIENPVEQISQSTHVKAFYEEAIAQALCHGKPLLLRKSSNRYFLVVDHQKDNDEIFQPLKMALGFKGKPGWIRGRVQENNNAFWAEAISIKLEERNGQLWLLLKPDIWVTPLTERQNSVDFLRTKRRYRYNPKSYEILDSWIRILFGAVGGNREVTISCFPETSFPAAFKINTRSAFSLEEAANAA